MNAIERINAYRKLLDDINSAIGRVDEQMGILVKEYDRLNALHEKVSSDITLEMAAFGPQARN